MADSQSEHYREARAEYEFAAAQWRSAMARLDELERLSDDAKAPVQEVRAYLRLFQPDPYKYAG